jgi:peptide/nickel transport system ATP-binding protein
MSMEIAADAVNDSGFDKWQSLIHDGDALLRISDFRVVYRTERATAHAINGLDFVVHKGESVGLVGETGAGKTTTALSILNLLPPDTAFIESGTVEFNGQDVRKMSKAELKAMRGGKVSMIFQNPLTALNPVFTVGEQIAMVLRVQRGLGRKEAMDRAAEMLEVVGIPGYRLKDYPHQFSGGMRQRVGIAAALACNPQLLIADEPTTALDVTIQAQILELMRDLQTKYDASLLMITHNLGIISELCQRVAVMYAGRIIEYGLVKDVFKSPKHPYTVGLIGALPALEGPRERLTAIPGTIANPQNLPTGCAFHPRCDKCTERCKTEQPQMREVGENHFVECFAT